MSDSLKRAQGGEKAQGQPARLKQSSQESHASPPPTSARQGLVNGPQSSPPTSASTPSQSHSHPIRRKPGAAFGLRPVNRLHRDSQSGKEHNRSQHALTHTHTHTQSHTHGGSPPYRLPYRPSAHHEEEPTTNPKRRALAGPNSPSIVSSTASSIDNSATSSLNRDRERDRDRDLLPLETSIRRTSMNPQRGRFMTAEFGDVMNIVGDFKQSKRQRRRGARTPSSSHPSSVIEVPPQLATEPAEPVEPADMAQETAQAQAQVQIQSPARMQPMQYVRLPSFSPRKPGEADAGDRVPSEVRGRRLFSPGSSRQLMEKSDVESDDELQALQVTVNQPSRRKADAETVKEGAVVSDRPSKKRKVESKPIQGDIYVLNSSASFRRDTTKPHIMVVDWDAREAQLDPPDEAPQDLPQKLDLQDVVSVQFPKDFEGRKLLLKFSDLPGDPHVGIEFDAQQSLLQFYKRLGASVTTAASCARNNIWINTAFQKILMRRQMRLESEMRQESPQHKIDSDKQANAQPKRQKLVEKLQANEGETTDERSPYFAKLDRMSARAGTRSQDEHKNKPSIEETLSSPNKEETPRLTRPHRETRSMTQSQRHESPQRDRALSPIIEKPPNWPKPLIYPPIGKKRAEVEPRDLERLRDDEFLNDNLIGLYTRFIEYHIERKSPDLASRIYFFNSYFYARLTDKPRGMKVNYEGVAKWTRSVDLFGFDYVVVPINESAHWFLAIICNLPSLVRSKGEEKGEDGSSGSHESSQPSAAAGGEDGAANTGRNTPDSQANNLPTALDKMSLSDKGEPTKHTKKNRSKKRLSNPQKWDVNQPMIITFDSLGCPRSPTIRNIKDYIVAEAKSKRNIDIDIENIRGMTAKEIPLQKNYSDCGLYLLAYLERFAQDPDEFVTKLLRKEMDMVDDWPPLNSRQLRKRLRDFLLGLHEEQVSREKGGQVEKGIADVLPLHVLLPPFSVGEAEHEEGSVRGEREEGCVDDKARSSPLKDAENREAVTSEASRAKGRGSKDSPETVSSTKRESPHEPHTQSSAKEEPSHDASGVDVKDDDAKKPSDSNAKREPSPNRPTPEKPQPQSSPSKAAAPASPSPSRRQEHAADRERTAEDAPEEKPQPASGDAASKRSPGDDKASVGKGEDTAEKDRRDDAIDLTLEDEGKETTL